MIFNNNNNTGVKVKGLPLSKNLMTLSSFYLKDGELLKNRDDMFTTLEKEIENCNNIVVEKGHCVTIYCNVDKASRYEKELKWIKNNCKIYSLNDSRMNIVARDTSENCCKWIDRVRNGINNSDNEEDICNVAFEDMVFSY